jgi:alpha-amylase
VRVEKKFIFSRTDAEIQARYIIGNESDVPLNLWWGVEFNFTLLAGDAEDRYYTCPGHSLESARLISEGTLDGLTSFGMRDDWNKFQLSISCAPAVSLWRFPVETISQSEAGFERTYQGSCLLMHRKLELPPGQSVEHHFTLKISQPAH